jgi:hypothetical protein
MKKITFTLTMLLLCSCTTNSSRVDLSGLNKRITKIESDINKNISTNTAANTAASKYFGKNKINTKGGKTNVFTIKIPLSAINKQICKALGKSKNVKTTSSRKPVITEQKDGLGVENLSVNILGFKYKPEVKVKPYFAAKNTIGLKITNINHSKSGGGILSLAKKAGLSDNLLTDKMSSLVVKELGSGMAKILAQEITAKELGPDKVVRLSYSSKKNTVYARFADEFVSSFIGRGYALSGFKFTDNSFVASFGSKNTTPYLAKSSYNFAVGDGNVNEFLRKIKGKDVNFQKNSAYPTGVVFDGGAAARFTLSAKVPLPYKLKGQRIKAAFSARVRPSIVNSNTLALNIESMNLNRIYAGSKTLPNLPGFIQNMSFVQRFIIGKVTDAIVNANGLKEYIILKKTSAKRVTFQTKRGSFLPVFASVMKLIDFSAKSGVLYMGYKG